VGEGGNRLNVDSYSFSFLFLVLERMSRTRKRNENEYDLDLELVAGLKMVRGEMEKNQAIL
jgi:hypothetical protein